MLRKLVLGGALLFAWVGACGTSKSDEFACTPGEAFCACRADDSCAEGFVCNRRRQCTRDEGTAGVPGEGGEPGATTGGKGGSGATGMTGGTKSSGGASGRKGGNGGKGGKGGKGGDSVAEGGSGDATASSGGSPDEGVGADAGSGGVGEAGASGAGQGGVEPGTGGTPSTGGTGGNVSVGGMSGTGGVAGASGGAGAGAGAGGVAGTSGVAGAGGVAGTAGTDGVAGSTGGRAGAGGKAGNGGKGGRPGPGGCTEITQADVAFTDLALAPDAAIYAYNTSSIGKMGAEDYLEVQFYASTFNPIDNGEQKGTFLLGTGIDANFETCARCLLVDQDITGGSPETLYFATEGTMTVADASDHMTGEPNLTLSDVTLREVTIDKTNVSTLVPNGRCLFLAFAMVD